MNKPLLVLAGVIAAGLTIYIATAKREPEEPTEYTIVLSGKDYVSLPMIPEDSTPDAVFGVDVEVKAYDASIPYGWYNPSFLECGNGYLVRCAHTKTVTITGRKCVLTLDTLIEIYNTLTGIPYEGSLYALVGPGTKSINVSGTTLEGHIMTGSSEYTNTLQPMKAYWMEKPI